MKVAILGKLNDKFFAPFDDESWQIWGCNVHKDFYQLPRYDLWFDIHKKPSIYKYIPREKLILREDSRRDEIIKQMGGNWLNNSMCYMLGYAYLLGATDVAFYGCSLNDDTESRQGQRNALREMRMWCLGRGMHSITGSDPDLFREYSTY